MNNNMLRIKALKNTTYLYGMRDVNTRSRDDHGLEFPHSHWTELHKHSDLSVYIAEVRHMYMLHEM